jgi:hypothetical protein
MALVVTGIEWKRSYEACVSNIEAVSKQSLSLGRCGRET